MDQPLYRFAFPPPLPMIEVEASLALSLLAVESLHGEAEARLDAGHALDAERRSCVIDAGTPAGRNLIRLFTGFLTREFGEGGFRVERVAAGAQQSHGAMT